MFSKVYIYRLNFDVRRSFLHSTFDFTFDFMTFKIHETKSLLLRQSHNHVDQSNLWTNVEKHWRGNCFDYRDREAIFTWFFYTKLKMTVCIWNVKMKMNMKSMLLLRWLEDKLVGKNIKNLSKIFEPFLTLPNCVIKCKIVEKRINRGAGCGPEVPIQYKIFEPEKGVDWAERNLSEKLLTVRREELRIIPNNNLKRNIWVLLSRKQFFYPVSVLQSNFRQNLFKVNNWNTRTVNEICSQLTIKTPVRVSGVSIANFEQISHAVLTFPLITLSK